jgi:hypothetical protein
MLSMRAAITTAAVVVAFSAGWPARTSAQQKAPAPLITYFSHEKVDASEAHADKNDHKEESLCPSFNTVRRTSPSNMWQQRVEEMHECIDRGQAIHRAYFADPDVDIHALVRDGREGIEQLRQEFYETGLRSGEQAFAKLMYESFFH